MKLYDILLKHLPKEKDAVLDRTEDWGNEMWNRAIQGCKQALQKLEVDEREIKKIIFKIAEEHFAPITIGYKIDLAHAIASNMDKIIKEKK